MLSYSCSRAIYNCAPQIDVRMAERQSGFIESGNATMETWGEAGGAGRLGDTAVRRDGENLPL